MAPRPEKEMPFLDHLEELRMRLFWMVGAVALGLVAGFAIAFGFPQVIEFLTAPITGILPPGPNGEPGMLVTTTLTGAFKFHMAIAVYIAIVLALPVILYHIWGFLSPGLHQHERRVAIPVLGAGTLLFMAGVTVAFKLAVPVAVEFLIAIAKKHFQPLPTIETYFSLLMSMSLGFGLMFELPIVVLALTWLGVVTPQMLSRYRRHAIVILLVVCAFFTPPDLYSLSIMFLPVYLLYEVSIVLAYILVRRRNKRVAEELSSEGEGAA